MKLRDYLNLSESYELDEVWGRGKIDPGTGTFVHDRENSSQKIGVRAMGTSPFEKTMEKLGRVQGLRDLRQPRSSQLSPKNQRRERLLNTALRKMHDELSGQRADAIRRREESHRRRQQMGEELEVVLGYLLDEGFASSYESAAVIYENMSDDWIRSILG